MLGAVGPTYYDYDASPPGYKPGPGITLNWADGVTDVVYGFGGDVSTSSQQPSWFWVGRHGAAIHRHSHLQPWC